MRRIRRDVEFSVHSPDGLRWTWVAGLETGDGRALEGTAHGSEAQAVRLAIAAIDEALAATAEAGAPKTAVLPPPKTRTPDASPARPQARPSGLPAPVVLVAEDEALFRGAVVESLTMRGFTVLEAGDGQEALSLLKAHPEISLLVSDVRMPHLDGYGLVERGLALSPGLKVILMTGYAQSPPATLAAAGIGTLRKPFDIERLCRQAEEMTGGDDGTPHPSTSSG